MAINANAYSPKQFSFLIAEQDDWGLSIQILVRILTILGLQ